MSCKPSQDMTCMQIAIKMALLCLLQSLSSFLEISWQCFDHFLLNGLDDINNELCLLLMINYNHLLQNGERHIKARQFGLILRIDHQEGMTDAHFYTQHYRERATHVPNSTFKLKNFHLVRFSAKFHHSLFTFPVPLQKRFLYFVEKLRHVY